MELVLAFLAIIVIFFIGYMVGEYQMSKKQYTGQLGDFPNWAPPTASVEEVPVELLAGGDIERTLHIAGIKEASWEKQKEWADERKAQIEEKSALSDKQLMEYLESKNAEILVKAGIKQYDRNKGVTDLTKKIQSVGKLPGEILLADIATPKGYDPIKEEKMKRERARKEYERERENRIKIDFEALNFSRISNEARKQITEIVKNDIMNKLEGAAEVLPEVNNDIKKPKRKSNKIK